MMMKADSNNFTIHRIAIRSNEGPSRYCVSCDTEKDKGFWLYCPPQIGPQAIFICDDCLNAAKKHKFVTNGKPNQPAN